MPEVMYVKARMNSGRCYNPRARAEGGQRIEVHARCTEER